MIKVVYSTQHWIMPRIVMVVLAVLLAAIIATEGMARSFLAKPGKFFREGCDHVKLWGTLVLFAGYLWCLNVIGFTVTSMVFVFLFNVLYAGTEKKSLLLSAALSVSSALIISVLFGVVFNITLPSGICTLPFPQFGFTLY